MRSDIFNTDHLDDREYVLVSNLRKEVEELDIIPTDYILEYTNKLDDVSTLRIEIPRYITRGQDKIEYPLYNKIQGKQFILVKKNGTPIERFIIDGISEAKTRNNETKTITANSYETTLKSKTCLINEGMTRQLYKPENETLDVADGILNIFEQQTGWKVAHCDELARKETVEEHISITREIANTTTTHEKVEDNYILFEGDYALEKENNFALNFDISLINVKVIFDEKDESGKNLEYQAKDIVHSFVEIPKSVKHLKATFTSVAEERYGITYELTYVDDSTETFKYAFINCRNLKLTYDKLLITHITSQIEEKTVTKYRFLEHQSTYWYQYLKTTIQEAFDCYIFFNTYERTISVYDKELHGQWDGFYLDFDNLLTKITKTPKIDDLCTRLWIESNNVDITEVNPLGTSYIENYSYFINNGSMSNDLKNALERYYESNIAKQEEWLKLKNEKNATDQLLVKRNTELISLNEQIRTKNAFLTAYIKQDSKVNQERVAKELIDLEYQVKEKLNIVAQLQDKSDTLLEQMKQLGNEMSKEGSGLFSDNDLMELEGFTFEQTYKDDVFTKASSLYDYATELLAEKAKLSYTFSLEHNDLVKGIKHPLGWQWFIKLGAKVELDDEDIAKYDEETGIRYVTIYAYTYSPKNQTISSVDFNNNTKVIEATAGLASIGKLVHQTASMTDYWKSTWRDSEYANVIVSDIRKNGLDLAANIVRGGSTVNKVSMTEAGLFVIDANNENHQIYIGASLIALTDDRWLHSKTAIDTGGVIADTIVGRLLLGENLIISNGDNSFQILPEGLIIRDENGIPRIQMGINENKNPHFNLGTENDDNYLIFREDGSLDIKASSLSLTVGDLLDKEEIKNIVNQAVEAKIIAGKNYALKTNQEVVLQGDGSQNQIFKLYDLIKNGSEFFDKSTVLSFSWEYSGTTDGTIYARTGGLHNQNLTDTIQVSSTLNNGKTSRTNIITKGKEFNDLELVASNIDGEITISFLKFEFGEYATVWTPSSKDSDTSYTILLSNESQIIATNNNLLPLKTETFTTEVLVYKGNEQVTDFTIEPISSANGITALGATDGVVSFKVSNTQPLDNSNGSFEIIINVKDTKIKKVWNWTVVKQHVEGYINVTGDQIFRYTNDFTGTPSPSKLTLTATKHGTTAEGKWQYKNIANAWVDWKVDGVVVTDTTLVINPTDANYYNSDIKLLQVRYIVDTIYDEFTTYKISDGAKGEDGVSSGDAYTVILSNENHSFPCENDGTIPRDLSTYTQVITMKGTQEIPAIIDISAIDVPTGMLIRIFNNNAPDKELVAGEIVDELNSQVVDEKGNVIGYAIITETGVISASQYKVVDELANNISDEFGNTLVSERGIWIEFVALGDSNNSVGYHVIDENIHNVADENDNRLVSEGLLEEDRDSNYNFNIGTLSDSGTVTIPITVDGITFNKVFSWTKAKKGEQGETAKNATIVASSQVFKSEDGKVFTPNTITLKPILQKVAFSKWQYSINGGVRWIDAINGKNGITISKGELTIANNSNIFTTTTTTIVFKLITNDNEIYDTMTISRLSDGNLSEIEVGIRNWLLRTGTKKTIYGSGEHGQLENLYYLVNNDCLPLMGKTVTFSCDFEATAGTYGNMTVQTNGENQGVATIGYTVALTDIVSLNENISGHLTKTLELTDDTSQGFTGIQLCLNNVVGDITISNCILTIGDVQVTWLPAPEDGIDYSSELINELRIIDLQAIIKQNQESSDRIDQILGDNIVTATEKIDLLYDFDRVIMNKESATNYYNSVNDSSMKPLKDYMEETYDTLNELMQPIFEDMNSETEIKTDVIREAFKNFYQAYEALMSALQSSVMLLMVKHSTKIEQLEKDITLTASKTEVMADKVNKVDAHMKFTVDGFVEIYATTNGVKGKFATQITDQKLAFKENGQEVAYISNQEMYITRATITNQMDISNFTIKPSGKGGIMFIYKKD